MNSHAPSGIPALPQLQWGRHIAQVFRSGDELGDLLVPYFKAGLENNERCLWVTGAAFDADRARSALRASVADFDKREARQQIEITDGGAWYAPDEPLRSNDIIAAVHTREESAREAGYEGLRTNGNCAWLAPAQWDDFQDYESRLAAAHEGRRMICMCSYCEDQLLGRASLDVIGHHDIVLPPRGALARGQTNKRSEEARVARGVNKTLANVLSIMGSTFRVAKNMSEFRESFGSRILALADTNALLNEEVGATLRLLLENELFTFADDGERIVLAGPDVVLSPRIATPIGMALHELVANAAKYGALSVFDGRLRVEWTLIDGQVRLQWIETTAFGRQGRKRPGFGTQFLSDVLPKQVGAVFSIRFAKNGAKAEFEFPVR